MAKCEECARSSRTTLLSALLGGVVFGLAMWAGDTFRHHHPLPGHPPWGYLLGYYVLMGTYFGASMHVWTMALLHSKHTEQRFVGQLLGAWRAFVVILIAFGVGEILLLTLVP